jgi:tRNA A-37 threonylcarbamoyl transferase component Bud32
MRDMNEQAMPVISEAVAGPALTEKPCPSMAKHGEATVGDRIGRYKLLEKVGEGGWGVVYVADQEEPVRRRVALKVIKPGMDTRQVLARFEAERQALALMDHPNIARVLDGGTTDAGRPYFVMELVRGIKITDYCDQDKLSTRERLELFIQICHAVQHAHQKGIIHRDLKPSNILVTLHDGVAVPKVIDFGIAKATEGRLTDLTIYTELHAFIGTPAYMSPEQAEMSGLDIDTRTDIYSLGVLLYQLLTGKTPFENKELLALGLDEMRRTIREKEPVRPSTRLASLAHEEQTTTAKRRGVEMPKLIHLLRGDLDWIAMKCLEKDRRRRYETAKRSGDGPRAPPPQRACGGPTAEQALPIWETGAAKQARLRRGNRRGHGAGAWACGFDVDVHARAAGAQPGRCCGRQGGGPAPADRSQSRPGPDRRRQSVAGTGPVLPRGEESVLCQTDGGSGHWLPGIRPGETGRSPTGQLPGVASAGERRVPGG